MGPSLLGIMPYAGVDMGMYFTLRCGRARRCARGPADRERERERERHEEKRRKIEKQTDRQTDRQTTDSEQEEKVTERARETSRENRRETGGARREGAARGNAVRDLLDATAAAATTVPAL